LEQGAGSEFRDVLACPDQESPRDPNDALTGANSRSRRQLAEGLRGDVGPNHGEIAAVELKDVRASMSAQGWFGKGKTKASREHGTGINYSLMPVNPNLG
jgi:hypothetical protein